MFATTKALAFQRSAEFARCIQKTRFLKTEEFRIRGLMFVMQSYSWELPPPCGVLPLQEGESLLSLFSRYYVFLVSVFRLVVVADNVQWYKFYVIIYSCNKSINF